MRRDVLACSASRLPFVLKRCLVSEKTTAHAVFSAYVFHVCSDATKSHISQAVARYFGVDVVSVKTTTVPEKKRMFRNTPGVRSGFKKAVVRLKKGQVIAEEVKV